MDDFRRVDVLRLGSLAPCPCLPGSLDMGLPMGISSHRLALAQPSLEPAPAERASHITPPHRAGGGPAALLSRTVRARQAPAATRPGRLTRPWGPPPGPPGRASVVFRVALAASGLECLKQHTLIEFKAGCELTLLILFIHCLNL